MTNEKWLNWAIELQALAQAGLFYGRDVFDIERFQRIRDIAAEMLADRTELPPDTVRGLFCNETGYQTPKIETRAAVFRDGKILLVQEKDGLWALPGGWCDVLESVRSNTEKEVREEAGLDVRARRIIPHPAGRPRPSARRPAGPCGHPRRLVPRPSGLPARPSGQAGRDPGAAPRFPAVHAADLSRSRAPRRV